MNELWFWSDLSQWTPKSNLFIPESKFKDILSKYSWNIVLRVLGQMDWQVGHNHVTTKSSGFYSIWVHVLTCGFSPHHQSHRSAARNIQTAGEGGVIDVTQSQLFIKSWPHTLCAVICQGLHIHYNYKGWHSETPQTHKIQIHKQRGGSLQIQTPPLISSELYRNWSLKEITFISVYAFLRKSCIVFLQHQVHILQDTYFLYLQIWIILTDLYVAEGSEPHLSGGTPTGGQQWPAHSLQGRQTDSR